MLIQYYVHSTVQSLIQVLWGFLSDIWFPVVILCELHYNRVIGVGPNTYKVGEEEKYNRHH